MLVSAARGLFLTVSGDEHLISRLRRHLDWRYSLDNENTWNIFCQWLLTTHSQNHKNLPRTFRWITSKDATFANLKVLFKFLKFVILLVFYSTLSLNFKAAFMIRWLFFVLKCQKYKFESFNWKLIRTSSVHKRFQFGQSSISEEKYAKPFCQKIPL